MRLLVRSTLKRRRGEKGEVGKAGEEEWDRRRDPKREHGEKEKRGREVGRAEEEKWPRYREPKREQSEKERRERDVGRVEDEEWDKTIRDPEKEYRKCRERCQEEKEGRRAQQLCESGCEQRRRKDQIVGRKEGSEEEEEYEEEQEEEEEIGGKSGKPCVFEDHHFKTKIKTQEGRVRVLKRFTKRSKLFKGIDNYRVVIFEANPRTFVVPNHWDADVLGVVCGDGGKE